MINLTRFAAGIATGVIAMQLLKNKSAKETLEKTKDKLRDATVTSLEVIESTSAQLRSKLDTSETEIQETPKKRVSHKHVEHDNANIDKE